MLFRKEIFLLFPLLPAANIIYADSTVFFHGDGNIDGEGSDRTELSRPHRMMKGEGTKTKSSKSKSSKSGKSVNKMTPIQPGESPNESPNESPTGSSIDGDKQAEGRTLSEIRFNKMPPIIDDADNFNTYRYASSPDYVKGVHSNVFPLLATDYPLVNDNEKVAILRSETWADSVVLADDFQLYGASEGEKMAHYWLQQGRMIPYYPGDSGGNYWKELRYVVEVQIARRNDDAPATLNSWPGTWDVYPTLTDIAMAVKGEYPGFHQSTLLEMIFKEGVEIHRDLAPFRSVNDFVGTIVKLASINTWTIEAVAAINFMLKWNVGMPRPEEMVWLISKGEFTSSPTQGNVPEDIVASIESMDLLTATEFTAYEENGSPYHPSFPAMHSAASTISLWLPAICKVSAEQYCEALRIDYAVAYARTVAGVHYQMDNLAGLNIGQRIVNEQLPDMLAEKYGYNKAMMRTRLNALAFDWNTFDSKACTIDDVPVATFLQNAYNAAADFGYDTNIFMHEN